MFSSHPLVWLETQVHTPCICANSEHRQSLWLSLKDTWKRLSLAGNGEENGRESSCPAPTSCVWWQDWLAMELTWVPEKTWGQSYCPEILEQSKFSPALVQWNRTPCTFCLDQMTPIAHLIYSLLFLTLIETALWGLKCWKGKHQ